MDKQFCIESERLELRLATENDTDAIFDFFVRNKEYLAPFEPLKPDVFFTKKYWEKFIPKSIEDAKNHKALRFFIFKQEDKGRVIGLVNFEFIKLSPIYACDLGYSMDEHEQGKGYMSEALKMAIKYVFRELNIMRISGGYSPKNPKSGHVMRKLGFQDEHLIKKYIMIDGKWEDIMYMYLYNDEWIESETMT